MQLRLARSAVASRTRLVCTMSSSRTIHSNIHSESNSSNYVASPPRRVFSGIQPTGTGAPHIGNLLGSLAQWRDMSKEILVREIQINQHEQQGDIKKRALRSSPELLFCVVDLHAMTGNTRPLGSELRDKTERAAAALVACGIQPSESCAIYAQSAIGSLHAELAWILGTLAPLGQLTRMTQFKSKRAQQLGLEEPVPALGAVNGQLESADNKMADEIDGAYLGLLSYPVLMAADIALFRATHVPVGDDQRQHLELASSLVRAFNRTYAKHDETARIPVPRALWGELPRVMSLRNPQAKMSKSGTEASRIDLTDTADIIRKKISRAVTDSESGIMACEESVEAERVLAEARPGVWNLAGIYAALTGTTAGSVLRQFDGQGTSMLKAAVADVIVENVCPIGARMEELITGDRAEIRDILRAGADSAERAALTTLADVRRVVGLHDYSSR